MFVEIDDMVKIMLNINKWKCNRNFTAEIAGW